MYFVKIFRKKHEMSDSINPIIEEFLIKAKRFGMYHSYGEFEGFHEPSMAELLILKGLLDGAIHEKQKEEFKKGEL